MDTDINSKMEIKDPQQWNPICWVTYLLHGGFRKYDEANVQQSSSIKQTGMDTNRIQSNSRLVQLKEIMSRKQIACWLIYRDTR